MVSTIVNPTSSPEVVASPERLRMTYDEYVEWYDREAGRRGEWVDGEVVVFMPTVRVHELVLHFLHKLLGIVVELREIGSVTGSGYELRTRDGAAREPDLMVLLSEHEDRATDRRLLGAADIVVEIISPDSVTRDRRDKLAEYAAAGVPEYWVIDPRDGKESFELFVLDGEGFYVLAQADRDGRVWSSVLAGVWFELAWLTAETLPKVTRLALQMAENPESESTAERA